MKRISTSAYITRSLMATLFVLVFILPHAAAVGDRAQGTLVAVGGGELPNSIWNQFAQLAGGLNGRLVVIPTATADDNLPTQEDVAAQWRARGIDITTLLHSRDADAANNPDFAEPIRQATAVWISGGDQSRLSDAYAGTAVERELKNLLDRGGVVGGTSAGAAVLSRVMITGGQAVPTIGSGFDLVHNAIVDQHVLRRDRINRLLHAVRTHPDRVGLGIDEGTALVIRGSDVRVIGRSSVFVVTEADVGRPLQILTFRDGEQFDLARFRVRPERLKWAIVIHGGAGTSLEGKEPERVQAYHDAMEAALTAGKAMLERGDASLDAVESVIRQLEDNPLFNAGNGAVFNSEGEHELDASIMDGRTMAAGAVAGVRTVKNPIGLARRVMEKTKHILLAGSGAESFATEQEVPRVANHEFSTDEQRDEWKRARAAEQNEKTGLRGSQKQRHFGTVGCVALDTRGDIAAGTSTGGLTNKKFGRVGDSPIIGAGTYADNASCGISATGIGEQFIRHAVAAQISHLMRHRGWSLQQAADYVLLERLRPEDGGIIGVDRNGEIVCVFTTPGMARAAADATGRHEVHFGGESH